MEWNKTLIIAEAGVNHNGSLELAMKMVDEAKRAGADIVKFQTAIPEAVMSRYAPKAEYQKYTTDETESQLEMCKKIHLKFDEYYPLYNHCKDVGIKFLSAPFDLESIDFLEELEENVCLSARNLANVKLVTYREVNAYDLVSADNMVITEGALTKLEEVLINE